MLSQSSCSATEPENFSALTHPIEYIKVKFSWLEPTTGSKVARYIVQHKIGNSDWYNYATTDTNIVWLKAPYNEDNVIRVAGIDLQNRQGPWSVSSDVYNPSIYYTKGNK